jgi:hypothetical protein
MKGRRPAPTIATERAVIVASRPRAPRNARRANRVAPPRLTCHVHAPPGEDLPAANEHPFWLAIDELADAVAAWFEDHGVDPDALGKNWEHEEGSLLTISSDAPSWAAYFWIYLPPDAAMQAEFLPMILDHLTRARHALPAATWQVALDDAPVTWADDHFRLLA